MAMMTKCNRCSKRIEYHLSLCSECDEVAENEKKERIRKYDKEVRYSKENKKYADFYNSSSWIRLSEIVKLNYFGLCGICAVENADVIAESDVTHHVVELKKDWELRLIEDNLIPLCHSCHESIHINYSENDKLYLRNVMRKFKERYVR